MKKKNLILILSLTSTLSIASIGCGSAETSNIADAETPLADSTENAEDTLLYGTLDLSYADFYYGELNQIEPETDASKGQYDSENLVIAAGYE